LALTSQAGPGLLGGLDLVAYLTYSGLWHLSDTLQALRAPGNAHRQPSAVHGHV